MAWKKLKKYLEDGWKQNRWKNFKEKRMQRKLLEDCDDDGDEYRWLQCKTDPKKTAAIFDLQMQLVETMLWKKMRGMMDQKQCRLCSKFKETV